MSTLGTRYALSSTSTLPFEDAVRYDALFEDLDFDRGFFLDESHCSTTPTVAQILVADIRRVSNNHIKQPASIEGIRVKHAVVC